VGRLAIGRDQSLHENISIEVWYQWITSFLHAADECLADGANAAVQFFELEWAIATMVVSIEVEIVLETAERAAHHPNPSLRPSLAPRVVACG